MAIDSGVLELLTNEFQASKIRQADAQARIDALTTDIEAWQMRVDEEAAVQAGVNDALVALGEQELS